MLAWWALATGRQAGTELRGISDLDLPASLVPTFSPRVPIVSDVNVGSGELLRDSFYTQYVGGNVGVAAQTDTEVIALAKGDWELFFSMATQVNFTDAFTINRISLEWVKPPAFATNSPFLTHWPVNSSQQSSITLRFVTAIDDFRVRFRNPALAGGQNIQWAIWCLGARMG